MEELAAIGTVSARSAIIATAPVGPSQRRFANAAVLLESELTPDAMLAALQWMEHEFGRRRAQRWGDRVIDLDIVMWGGGVWQSDGLHIPHAEFRQRTFVLTPTLQIAPDWRDPETGLSIKQLFARLTKARPIPR